MIWDFFFCVSENKLSSGNLGRNYILVDSLWKLEEKSVRKTGKRTKQRYESISDIRPKRLYGYLFLLEFFEVSSRRCFSVFFFFFDKNDQTFYQVTTAH